MDPFRNLDLPLDPNFAASYAMTHQEQAFQAGQGDFELHLNKAPQAGAVNPLTMERHNPSGGLKPFGQTISMLDSDQRVKYAKELRDRDGYPKVPPSLVNPTSPATDTKQNLAPWRTLPPEALPNKMGLCASKPHTSDATFHSSNSSTTSASTSSPARPSTSVFEYRTAELSQANENGICVGLTAEWLLNRNNSASARMNALIPGSERHASAAVRQQQYQDLKDVLRSEGAGSSQADLQAQNTVLQEAGLAPSGKEKKHKFGEPSSFSRMLDKITEDGSTHLLSLYFAQGGAHTIATTASNGMTTLFDPNYGEFTVGSREMASLFQSLTNRYRNPNGQHLSTVTTQRMY
ncbi:YopT-type cysteine protease domain-containing protein [Mesorhizobium newzealandense]|uniref:YopT-type cysteine protease domain-containing protein n=3 Tax=Mesorhizobium TaxID=68287 RepID=A0ABW4W9K5_9HYPH|nr:YopT-type cysteine protease domain-containing protein [Mesorhizobium sophorae]